MILSKFFPQWCYFCHRVFCEQTNTSICPQCFYLLPWWDEQLCANCNKPKIYCYDCKGQPTITPIFSYEPPISSLVVSMKYRKNFSAARMLKKLLTNWINAYSFGKNYDFILPTPIHWRRFLGRNFNSAEYLLPNHWKKIFADRVFHAPPQTSLSIYQRKKLLKQKKVFRIPKTENLRGKKILIFDDVITTKSTIFNLTREVQKATPSKIKIFCLARSIAKSKSASFIFR